MASVSTTLASTNAGFAAPTAGTAIATVTTPPQGTYRVKARVSMFPGGTAPVPATDANNVVLKLGSTTAGVVPCGSAVGLAVFGPEVLFQVYLDGVTSVTLNAVANASATTEYCGSLLLDALIGNQEEQEEI
jgi:hypothetical protein